MLGNKTLLALAFAAAAPVALAAPVTLTNTSFGTVTEASISQHSDIPVGVRYELTTVAHFDTDDYVQGTGSWQPRESVRANDITITLKAGEKTFVFQNDDGGIFLTTQLSNYNGKESLSLGIDFYEPGLIYNYVVSNSVKWNEGTYAPPMWLLPGTDVTYAAPFTSSVNFYERLTGERTGDIVLTADSMHISVSAVPEPATYGMLFAGLGIIGLMSRRVRGAAARQR
jgi:hypothetical protein